jgi:hypothetical protein
MLSLIPVLSITMQFLLFGHSLTISERKESPNFTPKSNYSCISPNLEASAIQFDDYIVLLFPTSSHVTSSLRFYILRISHSPSTRDPTACSSAGRKVRWMDVRMRTQCQHTHRTCGATSRNKTLHSICVPAQGRTTSHSHAGGVCRNTCQKQDKWLSVRITILYTHRDTCQRMQQAKYVWRKEGICIIESCKLYYTKYSKAKVKSAPIMRRNAYPSIHSIDSSPNLPFIYVMMMIRPSF